MQQVTDALDQMLESITSLRAALLPLLQADPQAVLQDPEGSVAPDETLEYADVANAAMALNKEFGRDALVSVLGQFGAKTLKEIPATEYTDVMRAMEKAMVKAAA
jgi:hypothetical protein